jgi:methionyl-tRNA synthetase
MPLSQDEADERWARNPKAQAKLDAQAEKTKQAKRQKYGGRQKGSINKRTLSKIAEAEREVTKAHKGATFAIDHMDEMIDYFRGLIAVHQPWNTDGSKKEGKDDKLWFRCVEVFQGFLNMRAPYQSPRLSAVAIMPQQARQKTVVNVTILNEQGNTVYSDTPGDDAKIIEHDDGGKADGSEL